MYENLSKEELAKKMREKVQSDLSSDGPAKLIIHNLENFAHRYLVTSVNDTISCDVKENCFWVESIEPDILEALKWQNKEVKENLIRLCKSFPGPQSKDIKVKLLLKTYLETDRVKCQAIINWDFPHFQDSQKQILKECTHSFEDYLDLRNKHAAWLEELTDLFL